MHKNCCPKTKNETFKEANGKFRVFLVTADKTRNGTATQISYSGVFIDNGTPNIHDLLNETEIDVIKFLQDDDSDCVKCGCVTGYTESLFTEEDHKLLSQHGLNKRFNF